MYLNSHALVIPCAWCVLAGARGLGGSTGAETLYHLSLALPAHSVQYSPPSWSHLKQYNTVWTVHSIKAIIEKKRTMKNANSLDIC